MYIRVKVTPGAKKEEITQISELVYEIKVKEKAERNQANQRVIDIIAHIFGKSAGSIKLVSGHHSRTKMFSVND
ncbi:MAG: hypothetical protein COV34_02410 [Candidatus Zambryskibacteria bacterium CG10_big_fil_rev_8_21_14_0_10_42_12]|uniref:Uncharacterized protein n=1 Tax=Candidatus Zambryskibacteria bacterium CG10_big_fil_rev_8_21_14_0_10_42_12 TaxID=1975115 RepID=A0A2H0QUF9_9BACT|nr:MAG: hypothetical protein COV34_02410 [Candidatus Zambryskibacteria bacterium CG10_big_fil_rev_8_21_14_0_10_42_12]